MSGRARTINFQALIPQGFYEPGLTVYLRGTLSFSGGERFVAEICRRRLSDQGRDLKPEHVITICAEQDESLPELLRTLAHLFERTEPIEMGE